MKNNRCFGITRNLHRCSREGDWKLFCAEHSRQWFGWLFTLIFTVGAGAASISSVMPSFFPRATQSIEIPGENNLERAISMAKMEGVKFRDASATEVLAKFYVRPTASYPLNEKLGIFALVSVSPFRPEDSEKVFDPGDCRFLGHVISFDPMSRKAVLSIKTISCTDNANQVAGLENEDYERSPTGLVASVDTPTEMGLILSNQDDGTYSVPMFGNVLIKFVAPVQRLKAMGKTSDRF